MNNYGTVGQTIQAEGDEKHVRLTFREWGKTYVFSLDFKDVTYLHDYLTEAKKVIEDNLISEFKDYQEQKYKLIDLQLELEKSIYSIIKKSPNSMTLADLRKKNLQLNGKRLTSDELLKVLKGMDDIVLSGSGLFSANRPVYIRDKKKGTDLVEWD